MVTITSVSDTENCKEINFVSLQIHLLFSWIHNTWTLLWHNFIIKKRKRHKQLTSTCLFSFCIFRTEKSGKPKGKSKSQGTWGYSIWVKLSLILMLFVQVLSLKLLFSLSLSFLQYHKCSDASVSQECIGQLASSTFIHSYGFTSCCEFDIETGACSSCSGLFHGNKLEVYTTYVSGDNLL